MDPTIHLRQPGQNRFCEVIQMKNIRGLYQFKCKRSGETLAEKIQSRVKQMRIAIQIPILVCCLFLSCVIPAVAQSTFGSVRGIVQDNTSAAISDTQVVLHSTDENTERTVTADASGNFVFENVKAGKYSLHAHRDGFADTQISGITVEARQDVRLTVSLTVAAQMTTVEVTSGGEQINTENATLGDSKDNLQMTQLT